MSRRTTVLLDEDVYRRLVEESLRRYGTAKATSRVINELLKRAFKGEANILNLIFSEKVAKIGAKEFEDFRRELSRRLES